MTIPYRLSLFSQLDSPREIVRQFTPNWFAATMGTGVLAIALAAFPLFKPLGEALWLLNIGLFAMFTALFAARCALYPRAVRQLLDHPVMSMFLGCAPMGLATIVNGFVIFGPDLLGPSALTFAASLWRLDALLALACGLLVPFAMFTRQTHGLDRMTGVWLLPIVAAEVAAASAGLLIPHLPTAAERLEVLVWGYALWACSAPLALSIIAILVLRMILHKLPEANMASTTWLALGPIATGALGLLSLGEAAPAALAGAGLGAYGATFRGVGLIGGLLLWGYGLWWLTMAALVTLRQLRLGLPFNLGWWGYTFPLGVYALATLRLASLLPIPALTVLAHALVAALALIWVIVAARTAQGAWTGKLFFAPCLSEA